jgi:hypothetical protein
MLGNCSLCSRAANGVIIITTKRGSGAKTKVTYDGFTGWTEPYRLFDIMNAEQYLAHKNLAYANSGSSVVLHQVNDANGDPIDTNWADVVYQKGFLSHAIGIRFIPPIMLPFYRLYGSGWYDQENYNRKIKDER